MRPQDPFALITVSLLALAPPLAGHPASVYKLRLWVEEAGYPFEEHSAEAEDGHLLALFRLPKPGAPALLLQHGILDSAWCWVFNREFKALAFQLYDAGYDVWLGNNRGNGFSERWGNGADASRSLSFWNFTFDEMARRDVPALVGAAWSATGRRKLAYLGHSQGALQFFIAASTPELQSTVADRVSVFIALSPVAWLGHMQSPLLRALAATHMVNTLWLLFPYGVFESHNWRETARILCAATLGIVCQISVELVCGSSIMDEGRNIAAYVDHFPFGTSFKNLIHFSQAVDTGTLQHYEYGPTTDMLIYGSFAPPVYNLSRMAVPTALLLGEQDLLADSIDVDRLVDTLAPTGRLLWKRRFPGFSHVTWFLGSADAGHYTADVLRLLREHHAPPVGGVSDSGTRNASGASGLRLPARHHLPSRGSGLERRLLQQLLV